MGLVKKLIIPSDVIRPTSCMLRQCNADRYIKVIRERGISLLGCYHAI